MNTTLGNAGRFQTGMRVFLQVMGMVVVLLAGISVRVEGQAAVPQPDALPTAGRVTFTLGTPDPYLVSVTYGGGGLASFGADCPGQYPAVPSFVVEYQGGLPLVFFTFSDGDTTLAVATPDNTVICNDDAENTRDAAVLVNLPTAGRYAVFVGGYNESTPRTAFLVVSTQALGPALFSPAVLVARSVMGMPLVAQVAGVEAALPPVALPAMLDFAAPALVASPLALTPGQFSRGGVSVSIPVAGGPIDMSGLPDLNAQGCVGHVTLMPTFEFDLTAPLPAIGIRAQADADSTILVADPNGGVYCNDDDLAAATTNPRIFLVNPVPGRYVVYLGSYAAGGLLTDSTISVTDEMGG